MLRNTQIRKRSAGAREGRWIASCVALAVLASGCMATTMQRPRPSMAGRYAGVDAEGHKLELSLWEDGQGVAGLGQREDKTFGVSLVQVTRATGQLRQDGQTRPAVVEVAADGTRLTFGEGENAVMLKRLGGSIAGTSEPFSGRFALPGEQSPVVFQLLQRGNLVVGTGYLHGQPLALSGVVESGKLQADAVFADGLRTVLTGALSGGKLSLSGLGFELALERTSGFDPEAP